MSVEKLLLVVYGEVKRADGSSLPKELLEGLIEACEDLEEVAGAGGWCAVRIVDRCKRALVRKRERGEKG